MEATGSVSLRSALSEAIERRLRESGGEFRWNGDQGSFHPAIEGAADDAIAMIRDWDVDHLPSERELRAFSGVEQKARMWDYLSVNESRRRGLRAAAIVRRDESYQGGKPGVIPPPLAISSDDV